MKNITYIFISSLLITSNTHNFGMGVDEIRDIGICADKGRAERLLAVGMDVNAAGLMGENMLVSAIRHEEDRKCSEEEKLEFIDFLLSRGADLQPNAQLWTHIPMLAATEHSMAPRIMSLLKARGADINVTHPSNGMTPLHRAAWNGRADAVKFLLAQKNIEINRVDNDGMTPLMRAAFFDHLDVVKSLVDKGAKRTMSDHEGKTALDHARENSCSRVVKYLKRVDKQKLSLFGSLSYSLGLSGLTSH